MTEADNKQSSLAEISEILADQSWKIINFENRLKVAEIRLRLVDTETDLIDSDIRGVRESLKGLIDPILAGTDVRVRLSEIDSMVQGIEGNLAA